MIANMLDQLKSDVMKTCITTSVSLILVASVASALAADHTYEFTLPSKVDIRIVESSFGERPRTACPDLANAAKDRDYKPKTYVKSIQARYQGQTIRFDVTCMTDAWNGRPLQHANGPRYFGGWCEILRSGVPQCAFRGVFADGSEAFVAEWWAFGSKAKRTVLSSSSDLMDLFLLKIDPPRY